MLFKGRCGLQDDTQVQRGMGWACNLGVQLACVFCNERTDPGTQHCQLVAMGWRLSCCVNFKKNKEVCLWWLSRSRHWNKGSNYHFQFLKAQVEAVSCRNVPVTCQSRTCY